MEKRMMQEIGSPISESDRSLMPDFEKWRRVLFDVECILVVVIMVVEIVTFVLMGSLHMIQKSTEQYLFLNVVLPTLGNIVIVAAGYFAAKHYEGREEVLNALPAVVMTGIGLVACFAHASIENVMCIFCIPVFVSAIFSDTKLCHIVTGLGTAGILATAIKYYFFDGGREGRWIFAEALTAVCFLVVSDMLSMILIQLMQGQKEKIMQVAVAAKQAQHREEEANRSKSRFLATMSHEMRTPINAVLGMNEMILREAESRQLLEYAANIQAAGNSLLMLINDILDISKIESGKMEIIENNYETASLIHDICNMVGEQVKEKGLYLEVKCDDKLPRCMKGDALRIRQIVINLLSNAIKYTPKGEIIFSVGFWWEEEKFFLILSVKDTGIGIKEENIGDLFLQFQRFDMKKNRNIEGTGLGLSITKQLVDLMGGEIRVESVYGVGSEFTVIIPQKVTDGKRMGDFHRHYKDARLANKTYRESFEAPDARILVVDDVEINLKVIRNLLKATKMQIDTADSGMECLRRVEGIPYDIIFMDHMMRGMDGVETFQKMKELGDFPNRNTPVIMLTANALSGVEEEYKQEGFADYMSKPVRGTELEEMIRKYLPPEKIRSVEKKEEKEKKQEEEVSVSRENMLLLQELYQKISGLNVFKGLENCGQHIREYLGILGAFASGKQLETVDNYYKKDDIDNYQVQMNALKTMLRTLGFDGYADQAELCADTAGKKDQEKLRTYHKELMRNLEEVPERLREICSSQYVL